jgi:APA family basic amino acid/polyamine antiporter
MDYTEAAPESSSQTNTREAVLDAKSGLLRGISLADATLLLVGGIIGTGIFLTSGDVAAATHTPLVFIAAWITGMLVSWLASVSVAELGAMFPEAGGQYVYLREAYGEFVAFLYGWMIFSVNVCGSLAAIAVGFAYYMGAIIPPFLASRPLVTVYGHTLNCGHVVAVSALVFLTWINIVGLRPAIILQNFATWAKFISIGAFLLLGFSFGHGHLSYLFYSNTQD